MVADHRTKGFDVIRRNTDIRTGECVTYVKILRFLIITKPQSPVELFDAFVTAFPNLVDGHIWMRWLIFELKESGTASCWPLAAWRPSNNVRLMR